MRLLITTDTVGGVWSYSTSLIEELLPRGVAVALVTIGPVPSLAQAEWLTQTCQTWGAAFHWEVCDAPLEWMSNNSTAYDSAASLLTRVAREFSADLLHSNQFCFGRLPLAIPRLVVAHSDVFSWAAACRDTPLEPAAWLDRYAALVSRGLEAASAIVAPTRWMLQALAQHFALPVASMVIDNGRTLPEPTSEPEKKLQAVTAGRLWDEAKNIQLLNEVLAHARAPFPLLIAGETALGARALPAMKAGVSLLGRLEQEALLQLFRASAIYLCTSRYEPFGLAPLEAGLCGCAVVANDIPSLREVWSDGALFFSNAASLSALLAELSIDPDRLAAAQGRSWRRARKYTAARMADNYLALYRAALAPGEVASHVA